MEELLNKLIDKGWKPFGDEYIHGAIKAMYYVRFLRGREKSDREIYLRQIVSKESGLWQFVCENKLVEHGFYTRAKWQRRKKYDDYWKRDIPVDEPEYRVIESALKDESELEYFLLSNIKI